MNGKAVKLTPMRAALSSQEHASQLLHAEIEEIVEISQKLAKSMGFLKSRLKTPFPKVCSKCAIVYESFEQFFYGTVEIEQGTVCYPILDHDFYLHRNCPAPCHTTLVVVFGDRRDESDLGRQRRQIFENCLDKLRHELQLDEINARDVLLIVLAQHLKPPRALAQG